MVYFSTVSKCIPRHSHRSFSHLISSHAAGAAARGRDEDVATARRSSSERLRPAGPNSARYVIGGPAYGSAFAFAGFLPSCFATAQ